MKKFRTIACFLAAALIAASFAGCGADKTANANNAPSKQEQNNGQQTFQGGGGAIAKVVSLNGDQLTVVLADQAANNRGGTPPAINAGSGGGSTPPGINGGSGGTPPDNGTSAAVNGKPEGGGPGAPGDGSGQPGQGGGQIQFTGESVTYTLSSDVSVVKGMGDSAKKNRSLRTGSR